MIYYINEDSEKEFDGRGCREDYGLLMLSSIFILEKSISRSS